MGAGASEEEAGYGRYESLICLSFFWSTIGIVILAFLYSIALESKGQGVRTHTGEHKKRHCLFFDYIADCRQIETVMCLTSSILESSRFIRCDV